MKNVSIKLKDNSEKSDWIADSSIDSEEEKQMVLKLLQKHNSKSLEYLSKFSELSVFSFLHDTGSNKSDESSNKPIYSLSADNQRINTYNIMGILRLRDQDHDLEV